MWYCHGTTVSPSLLGMTMRYVLVVAGDRADFVSEIRDLRYAFSLAALLTQTAPRVSVLSMSPVSRPSWNCLSAPGSSQSLEWEPCRRDSTSARVSRYVEW